MLPKKHRLSKSTDVIQTTVRGRGFFNPLFIIKNYKTSERAKITVIVSTKVSKKAVTRNRIKRIMRVVIRQWLPDFKTGNYAFIVKKPAAFAQPEEIRNEVQKSLQILFSNK